MLGPSTACNNEFLATCLLENRKAIQGYQNEHKNSDPQTLRKLLEDALGMRQQIVQADEKNSEKMKTFQEENAKTSLELESLREGKIRAHYACVLKENQVRLGLLRARALFIVCRHYAERFSNNMAFLATLKQRINYNFSIALEINKNKLQKTFFSSSSAADAEKEAALTQLMASNGAPNSARQAVRKYSSHSLLLSAEAMIDVDKERAPRVEVKIADLPDVKPDLTLSMPIDFADLIGINLEEYSVMREQATQFLKQQSATAEKDTKDKEGREDTPPAKAEPSGMLTNRSPGKDKEKPASKKAPVGVRFLVGLKKDKSKAKK